MAKNNSKSVMVKAAVKAVAQTIGPEALNIVVPWLGSALSVAMAYREQLASQNMEQLYQEISVRMDHMEERLSKITDGARADKIEKIISRVREELNIEKIRNREPL